MKVAVVTGGNKGIGFAIVQGLCKQLKEYDVLLTGNFVFDAARDETRGKEAVEQLKKSGVNPKFFPLDITNQATIENLKKHLQDTYGGLDILVNNAGMAYKGAAKEPFSEQASVTMETNFTGTLNVCKALFPLLRQGARVVHVSSRSSTNSMQKCSKEIHNKFSSMTDVDEVKREMAAFVKVVHVSSRVSTWSHDKCSDVVKQRIAKMSTTDEVVKEMAAFVEAAQTGQHEKQGYSNSAYGMSKVGVTVMTGIQQADIDKAFSGKDILVNSCCPGYVNTDMSSGKGPLSIEEGADTPIYLATLPPGCTSPKGDFCAERKILDWRVSQKIG